MNNGKFFYSASTNAVYAESDKQLFIESGIFPDDARLLPDDVFDTYFRNEPPEGKRRIAGKNGLPSWESVPPLTNEDKVNATLAERARLFSLASEIMTPLQYAVDLGMASDEEREKLTAWKQYCVLLMRIDPLSPTWPDVPNVA
ncbi:phage tail protein [Serratia sp. S1B]|nr:phage tail protein [Serratia sp. S1B]